MSHAANEPGSTVSATRLLRRKAAFAALGASTVALGLLSHPARAQRLAEDQYRAICTETAEHGGREYTLTAWLDSRDSANVSGKAHELRTRGHRWRVAERRKP
jgi:hypothetical protein